MKAEGRKNQIAWLQTIQTHLVTERRAGTMSEIRHVSQRGSTGQTQIDFLYFLTWS
jgi:hypothetical protein